MSTSSNRQTRRLSKAFNGDAHREVQPTSPHHLLSNTYTPEIPHQSRSLRQSSRKSLFGMVNLVFGPGIPSSSSNAVQPDTGAGSPTSIGSETSYISGQDTCIFRCRRVSVDKKRRASCPDTYTPFPGIPDTISEVPMPSSISTKETSSLKVRYSRISRSSSSATGKSYKPSSDCRVLENIRYLVLISGALASGVPEEEWADVSFRDQACNNFLAATAACYADASIPHYCPPSDVLKWGAIYDEVQKIASIEPTQPSNPDGIVAVAKMALQLGESVEQPLVMLNERSKKYLEDPFDPRLERDEESNYRQGGGANTLVVVNAMVIGDDEADDREQLDTCFEEGVRVERREESFSTDSSSDFEIGVDLSTLIGPDGMF